MWNSKYKYPGGKGAYASGIIALSQKTQFFLYPGGAGQKGIAQMNTFATGGWNGGSNSGRDIGSEADLPDSAGSGAGATDIRLIAAPEGEESTNEESLKSRIIVAGGGSGASSNAHGAPGGDIYSYKVITSYDNPTYEIAETGTTLGQGAVGGDHFSAPGSGAGGGYYGGFGSPGDDVDACRAVSGSGTSYVAGHQDCFPVTSNL